MHKRSFGLDFLRTIAILCVVLSHTSFLIAGKLTNVFNKYFGFIGVEVFFVLSGFLIGGILIQIQIKKEGTTFQRLKSFWIRRWLRTIPNYYLMLVVYFALHFFVYKEFLLFDYKYWLYFIFLQNIVTPHPAFFEAAWSLSIEEWFYLTFPIVILFFSWFISKFYEVDTKLKTILFSVLFYIIICLSARIVINYNTHSLWDSNFRKIMPLRLDSISIGVLFAYLKFRFPKIWLLNRKQYFKLGIIGFLSLSYFFINTYILRMQEGFLLKTFFFTLLSISVGFTLPFFENLTYIKNTFISELITKISIYSYSIYLTHPLIISILGSNKVENILHINTQIQFVLIWILVYFVTSFQYKYFEAPMTKLRDKWK